MKSLIIFAIIAATASALSQTALQKKWTQFKVTHKKEYSNSVEELRRMAIFNENLEAIKKHNEKYDKGEVTYTKAINQFGDMTKDEFLVYVNRSVASKPKIDEKLRRPWVQSRQAAAASVDWRSYAVSEVKNQGQCGGCWSFSATGAVEGQLALRYGQLISLSEQNLLDCSGDYGTGACDGGWMGSAFNYIHDNGIMSESAYPYEARKDYCRFDPSQSVTRVSGYYDLPSGDEYSLLNAVSNNGPVSVAIHATDELQFYSGGIFYDATCGNEVKYLNHGVLVVGYGSENNYDYWIIKNSWGSNWGEAGYWRAIRNYGNNCGVATEALYPVL